MYKRFAISPLAQRFTSQGGQLHPAIVRALAVLRTPSAMVAAALLIRLIVAATQVEDYANPRYDHWDFGGEMGHIGRSISNGLGFANPLYEPSGPTAEVAPAYPFLVGMCMKLFGVFTVKAAAAVLLLNCIAAAITCIPVYKLAQRLFGERVAIASGWMWSLFPYSIYLATGRIWENALSCMCNAFVWWYTVRLSDSTRVRDWMIWALWLGAVGLVSPAGLGTLPFLAAWIVIRRSKRGLPWFRQGILAALLFLAISAPWAIRNYATFHRLIPFRDNFWLEMHVGNNGDSSVPEPFTSAHPYKNPREYAEWKRLGEIAYMDAKKVETTNFILQHKAWYGEMLVRRFAYMWTGYWKAADWPNPLFNVPLTGLMLLGLYYAWKRRCADVLPMAIALAVFPIPYYISHVRLAFRHPVDPLLVILVCYGAGTAIRKLWDHRSAAQPAAAATV